MSDSIFLNLGIVLVTGLLFSKIAKLAKLPNVTGYLVGGLLIGPSVLGLIGKDEIHVIAKISELALAFIAFTIGAEFKISYFKKVGKTTIVIAIFEALFATIFVFIAVMLYSKNVSYALILGSIAAATAPAATLMVVKQYKAKGPVTESLLSVVALDDAVALIIFGINFAIAVNLMSPSEGSLAMSILMPVFEILASLLLGVVLGFIMTFAVKKFTGRSNRICVVLATMLLVIGISELLKSTTGFELSNLLTCMMVGAVLVNMSDMTPTISGLVDRFTPALFMSFFVISGAELELKALATVGVVGVLYVLVRVVGKWFGAWLGATITKAEPTVKKYLGFCLVPPAGVAIGLSIISYNSLVEAGLPELGTQVRTIILGATLIYELVGPLIVKISLKKANEIEQQ